MNWQEKIAQYKARQQEISAEEQKERLKIAKEKIPALVDLLERLNCEELLTQIRDEVWKFGEVVVNPDLDHITPETRVEANVFLVATWPYYRPGGYGLWDQYSDPEIATEDRFISIKAFYDEFDEILIKFDTERFYSKTLPASNPEIESEIEEFLIEDTITRQECYYEGDRAPYDLCKKRDEVKAIEGIINLGLKPPEGFEYLSDLAEKARRLQVEQQKLTSDARQNRKGCLSKLLGSG